MKKKLVIAVMLVLALTVLILVPTVQASEALPSNASPTFAAATEVIKFRFRGESASATLSSTEGCIITTVHVHAADNATQADTAFLLIDQFDTCTEQFVLFASGEVTLAEGEFQISKLKSATLSTTFAVLDAVSGSTIPVDVSLNWTGIGETTRQKDISHFTGPGIKVISRASGTTREAEASGSISFGTTNLTLGSSSAFLSSVKSGQVAIIRE